MTVPGLDEVGADQDLSDDSIARISAELAAPSWVWLTRVVRAAWEVDLSRKRVRIDLNDLDETQVAAMADFLRWSTDRIGTVSVSLDRLDRLLRTSGLGAGLVGCLTISGGPLHDAAGTRRAHAAARVAAGERVWSDAQAHPALRRHPALQSWLAEERAAGRLPADPTARGRVLADALAVLAQLPDPGSGLGLLATRALGHAHALDSGPVPAAVLRALGWLGAGVVAGTGADAGTVPATAAARRERWANVGIALDTVSSTVLVLGLVVDGDDALPRTLAANAAAGLPVRLTLGQVRHHLGFQAAMQAPGPSDAEAAKPHTTGPAKVWVCENPSVVEAAAERFREKSPPIVCVEGHPSVAAVLFLAALRAGGSSLAYHGDFDWPGLDIAATVLRLGAEPWRMSAADYQAGVSRAHPNLPLLPTSAGRVTSPWDDGLVASMASTGRQLEEEHVLDLLLDDLAVSSRRP